jgi:hypothetical protein
LVSEKLSPEFWHEFAEIHSFNRGACASNVATNAANDAPISHRDDRARDQREDAAQAGLPAGGSSGSQGDRRGAHWQRSTFVHRRSAAPAGRGGDPLFSKAFIAILKAGGVKSVKIPAQSPNCNPYAERFVKTIKYECLNQFVIFGERHLRHLIKEFVEHYMTERFHQVGGRLNYYHREAA